MEYGPLLNQRPENRQLGTVSIGRLIPASAFMISSTATMTAATSSLGNWGRGANP
jgi:hypothetical protein